MCTFIVKCAVGEYLLDFSFAMCLKSEIKYNISYFYDRANFDDGALFIFILLEYSAFGG